MSEPSRHRADLDGEGCWGEALQLGEHCFSAPEGERPKWMRFGCRRDSHGLCQISLRPQKNASGASWEWDGNRVAPTITPSINCEKVCGWHGWIREGKFSDA